MHGFVDYCAEMSAHSSNHPKFQQSDFPAFLCETSDGVLLSVKLQPRASQNEIGEPLGDALRIKVTAPPVDAAANAALIELLADQLDCPRGRIELVRGHKSRHKIVKLRGFAVDVVRQKLTGARNRIE
jgi:uncharacterized protein